MERKVFNLKTLSCSFCRELMDNRIPAEFMKQCGIVNRVFKESDNFVAVPSVSPITVGHVLIIPRTHITSLVQVKHTMISELNSFVTSIIRLVAINFKVPVIFEHGIGEGKVGGCGVNHAHLHILPVKPDSIVKVILNISKQFSLGAPIPLTNFLTYGDNKKSYLLFGQSTQRMLYTYNENIPSQYVRRLIAKEIDSSLWDWRQVYGWTDFVNTYKILFSFKTR